MLHWWQQTQQSRKVESSFRVAPRSPTTTNLLFDITVPLCYHYLGQSSCWHSVSYSRIHPGVTMRTNHKLRRNVRDARAIWGNLSKNTVSHLKDLIRGYSLSVSSGDLRLLEGKWYVTHSALLRIATRRHCRGIRTTLQQKQSDQIANRWVFRAIVYTSHDSKGFVGYGDADPSNVSPLV